MLQFGAIFQQSKIRQYCVILVSFVLSICKKSRHFGYYFAILRKLVCIPDASAQRVNHGNSIYVILLASDVYVIIQTLRLME